MRYLILTVIAVLVSILTLSTQGLAEYIRATNEEEVILISTDSEVKIGRSLAKQTEEKFGLDDDRLLQKRISDIGKRLVSVCDRKDITYHFKVLKGDNLKPNQRLNAFALPGGYVYIFKDMVALLENDDEIAGVLAHEIGHIAAKHSIKRLQGSLGATIFQILTSGIAKNAETKTRINTAIGLLMMSYSRKDEIIADRLSVRYVKKAGYNPEAIITTIDKMIEIHRKMPIRKYSGYSTHPYLSERKSSIKKEIYGKMDFEDFINAPTSTIGGK